MVDFSGWELPIQYSTITLEHNAVRNQAGLFDISHMGQVFVWGEQAENYLQYICSNDVRKAILGKGIYAHLLNEKGGVIDDIYIFRLEEKKFFVVVNAGTKEKDLAWMEKQKENFDCTLMEAPQAAGLALQGPHAATIIEKLASNTLLLEKNEIGEFNMADVSILVSRTGYTGEDGFELFAPAGHLLIIWDHIFNAGRDEGLVPCGLGARDTLRTEVGYPLYGHELDENHTPLEAGLGWVVNLIKIHLLAERLCLSKSPTDSKPNCLVLKWNPAVWPRPGGKIFQDSKEIGVIASGTFSPHWGVPLEPRFAGGHSCRRRAIKIQQGTREMQAKTVKMPFYKRSQSEKPRSMPIHQKS